MTDNDKTQSAGPRKIRKYANRRLYDTDASEFVTLADLADMVKAGIEFVVEDTATGDDLTSSVLIQIIAEQEANGEHLLPLGYLRQLIGFYGNDAGKYLTDYLEQTLQSFAANQQQMMKQFQQAMSGESPVQTLARQNMELFQNSMQAFASFAGGSQPSQGDAPGDKQDSAESQDDPRDEEIDDLRAALAALSKRVDKLGDS